MLEDHLIHLLDQIPLCFLKKMNEEVFLARAPCWVPWCPGYRQPALSFVTATNSAVFDSTILAMFWQTHKFDRTLGKLGLLPIYQNQVSNLAIYPISIDKNAHFGHSGQSDVSQNGLKWFPMSKNLGIDTKIKSLGLSKQKLQFWYFLVPWT